MAMFPSILGVMQCQRWVCTNPLLLPMDNTSDITLDQRYADADARCEGALKAQTSVSVLPDFCLCVLFFSIPEKNHRLQTLLRAYLMERRGFRSVRGGRPEGPGYRSLRRGSRVWTERIATNKHKNEREKATMPVDCHTPHSFSVGQEYIVTLWLMFLPVFANSKQNDKGMILLHCSQRQLIRTDNDHPFCTASISLVEINCQFLLLFCLAALVIGVWSLPERPQLQSLLLPQSNLDPPGCRIQTLISSVALRASEKFYQNDTKGQNKSWMGEPWLSLQLQPLLVPQLNLDLSGIQNTNPDTIVFLKSIKNLCQNDRESQNRSWMGEPWLSLQLQPLLAPQLNLDLSGIQNTNPDTIVFLKSIKNLCQNDREGQNRSWMGEPWLSVQLQPLLVPQLNLDPSRIQDTNTDTISCLEGFRQSLSEW